MIQRWRYEFDPDGGYDSCSAAFHVFADSDWRAFSVDVRPFFPGATHDTDAGYQQLHSRCPEAERLVAFIVGALNLHDR